MKSRAGYSLFEVLLAFTIMALVLSVLLPGQAALLRKAQDGPQQLLAQDFAMSRLADLGADRPFDEGVTDESYADWRVRQEISQVNRGGLSMWHVVITIIAADDQRSLALVESWRVVE